MKMKDEDEDGHLNFLFFEQFSSSMKMGKNVCFAMDLIRRRYTIGNYCLEYEKHTVSVSAINYSHVSYEGYKFLA